jgi:hypothetical protein
MSLRRNDIIYNVIDQYSGEYVSYNKVTSFADGTSMTDGKCDGVIYRKFGTEYFKRSFTGPLNIKWFGAKCDGVTDDTAALQLTLNIASIAGQNVFHPGGDCKITAPVTLTEYTGSVRKMWPNIIGVGAGIDKSASRIVAYNLPANRSAVELVGDSNGWVTNSSLVNIEINAEHSSNHDASFALTVGDARGFLAQRVKIRGKNALKLRCGSYNNGQTTYSMISTVFQQCEIFATIPKGWAVAHEAFFETLLAVAGYDNIHFKNCLFKGITNVNSFTAVIDNCMFFNGLTNGTTTFSTGSLAGMTIDFSTSLWISSGNNVTVTNCYFEDYKNGIVVQPIRDAVIMNVNITKCYINGLSNYPNGSGNPFPRDSYSADYGVLILPHPAGQGAVVKVSINDCTFRDGVGATNDIFNFYPVSNQGAKYLVVQYSGVFYPDIKLRVEDTFSTKKSIVDLTEGKTLFDTLYVGDPLYSTVDSGAALEVYKGSGQSNGLAVGTYGWNYWTRLGSTTGDGKDVLLSINFDGDGNIQEDAAYRSFALRFDNVTGGASIWTGGGPDSVPFKEQFSIDLHGKVTAVNDIEITDATKGIILKTADGTRARITLAKNSSNQLTLQISDPL